MDGGSQPKPRATEVSRKKRLSVEIEAVNVYCLRVPFKFGFSISYETLNASRPVLVEVVARGGQLRGYGEGLPVPEVTGETPETVLEALLRFLKENSFPTTLTDVRQVFEFTDSLPKGKHNHAATCALEMALLDLMGRRDGRPLVDYFHKTHRADTIIYGVPLPMVDVGRLSELCDLVKEMDIKRLRLKLGPDLKLNERRLATVTKVFSGQCEIRVDPNRAWNYELTLEHLPILKNYGVLALEEPMAPNHTGFKEISAAVKQSGIRLVACESVVEFRDVRKIVEEGFFDTLQIKLSRIGGLTRALRAISFLREKNVPFQIGCSRGETGLLSAAGRALAMLCPDAVYVEGCYDAFLLEENTTTQDVGFGKGGLAGPLPGPGLGVDVDSQAVKHLCVKTASIEY